MKTHKKLLITVIALMVALVVVGAGLIVVLVASQQQAKAVLKVNYVVREVSCELSARYAFGGNVYNMTTDGTASGATKLTYNAGANMEGSLIPVYPTGTTQIDLTKDNNLAVFEYKFVNISEGKDINIDYAEGEGEDALVANNMLVGYRVSTTQLDIATMKFENTLDTFSTQELKTNTTKNATLYIYVLTKIDSVMNDAEYSGAIIWNLSRSNLNA